MHMTPAKKTLLALVLAYAVASLVHFIHNAEYLADYPGLPQTWTREGVYLAWAGLTAIGVAGWALHSRGHARFGLLLLAIYALGGIDSLGHYFLAAPAAHSFAMHTTILLEVAAAAILIFYVARQAMNSVAVPDLR
jgi:hypothetical protein